MKNQVLPPQGKDYIHLKDFLNCECKAHLTQPLTLPQHKINVAYCTSHPRLAIENDRLQIILIPRDTILLHFHSCNVVKKEARYCGGGMPSTTMLKIGSLPCIKNKY